MRLKYPIHIKTPEIPVQKLTMKYEHVTNLPFLLDSSYLTSEEIAERDANPALFASKRYGQPEHLFRTAGKHSRHCNMTVLTPFSRASCKQCITKHTSRAYCNALIPFTKSTNTRSCVFQFARTPVSNRTILSSATYGYTFSVPFIWIFKPLQIVEIDILLLHRSFRYKS